jgi:hypothetical protein
MIGCRVRAADVRGSAGLLCERMDGRRRRETVDSGTPMGRNPLRSAVLVAAVALRELAHDSYQIEMGRRAMGGWAAENRLCALDLRSPHWHVCFGVSGVTGRPFLYLDEPLQDALDRDQDQLRTDQSAGTNGPLSWIG